jgi:hypothetical protein
MAGDVAGRLLRRLVGVVLRRVAAVEDGALDQESESGTDEERHDGSDREEADGVHGRSGLSTTVPRERIDGTQSPTKMPWSSWLPNHSATESTNEMPAASRMRYRAPASRETERVSVIRL